MKVSKVSFIADKQAQQTSTPETSNYVLQRPSACSLLCCAQHPTSAVAAVSPGLVATEQQPRSSLGVCSELTAKKGRLLLWMSKTISLIEINLKLDADNLRLMNSAMISYVSSFPGIQP